MKYDDIIEDACKRMKLAVDADRENRLAALDDMRNMTGEQWPEKIKADREAANRPCLTINRLPQFLRQVTGDLRNMNPAINILPADDQSSEEAAELVEGLVRQIQYASDASTVYERAGESAAACGMGFFRVLTDYIDNDTFDQEIFIRRISNPFSVYFDPDARESTREDARWCFITETMTGDAFREAYPDKLAADVEMDGQTDGLEYWRDGSDVIIAEYFWKEPETKRIVQLDNGMVLENPPSGVKFAKERTVAYDKIMWAKISGRDVLEGPQEFPSKYIPVIAVMGEELHVGDMIYRSSVIRFAKDPQRLYNYWRSAQTELIALQPKAPFIVTPKQVSGLETIWGEANDSNRPYLPYNPDEKAPAPQRATPPIPSAGMMQEVGLAAEDMKATTGVYDAGLGNQSNEKSGVAIRQRQMESDISTSIYSDNVSKAVAHCGRILIDMIPKIYDTQRALRIIGKDDAAKIVPVNQTMDSIAGPVVVNDLTRGKYDVRVAVGPNYSTMRQEAAQSMIEFIQAYPAAAPLTGDLVAKNMDWPGADQFAERLRKALPPGILSPDELPPDQQQQMMQAQQAQQMQGQKAQAMEEIAFREAKAKAEKAEADAMRSKFEADKAQLELATMTVGQIMPVTAQPY